MAHRTLMDAQTNTQTHTNHTPSLIDHPTHESKGQSAIVRIMKNPLFLVIFTWVLMAFLLAFEVSGK